MRSLKECLLNEVRINVKNAKAVKFYKYHPKYRQELIEAIKAEIKIQGNNADLNCIDTSKVEYMDSLFTHYFPKFNGDISGWDVSNVRNMIGMFEKSDFNGDISGWDVSNVKSMIGMFTNSKFDGDISGWDVSNVVDMSFMFTNSKFDGDISGWDVSNVKDMNSMFAYSNFNGDISGWDVLNVKDMDGMFFNSPLEFNEPLWYKNKNII